MSSSNTSTQERYALNTSIQEGDALKSFANNEIIYNKNINQLTRLCYLIIIAQDWNSASRK
jgi:hypothetical protein